MSVNFNDEKQIKETEENAEDIKNAVLKFFENKDTE